MKSAVDWNFFRSVVGADVHGQDEEDEQKSVKVWANGASRRHSPLEERETKKRGGGKAH